MRVFYLFVCLFLSPLNSSASALDANQIAEELNECFNLSSVRQDGETDNTKSLREQCLQYTSAAADCYFTLPKSLNESITAKFFTEKQITCFNSNIGQASAQSQAPTQKSNSPYCTTDINECPDSCINDTISRLTSSDGNISGPRLSADQMTNQIHQELAELCYQGCQSSQNRQSNTSCVKLTDPQLRSLIRSSASQDKNDQQQNLSGDANGQLSATDAEKCDAIRDSINSQRPTPAQANTQLAEVPGCTLTDVASSTTGGPEKRTGFETEKALPNNAQIEELGKACTAAQNGALSCCKNPLTCMNEGELESSSATDLGAFGAFASGGLGLALQSGAINQNCKLLKTASNVVAAGNVAMGAFCAIRRSSCMSTCEGAAEEIEKQMRKCNDGASQYNYTSAEHPLLCPYVFPKLEAAKKIINRGNRNCDSLSGRILQNISGAIQSAMASKLSDLCKKATDANKGLVPLDLTGGLDDNRQVFDYDCSNPANASNPLCQSCTIAANRSKPECKLVTNFRRPGDRSGISDPASNGTGSFDLPPDVDPEQQEVQFQNIEAPVNSSAGIRGGGGGGPPNSGGGKGGARRSGGKGGRRLKKTAQFAAPRRGSGGGFSNLYGKAGGFGTGDGKGSSKRGGFGSKKLINLKDYLPGGKKDPNKKTLGGALGLSRQIAGRSVNIWEKISNRYIDICRMDRLYGCTKQSFRAPRRKK